MFCQKAVSIFFQAKKSVEDLIKEGIPHDLVDTVHREADSVG
jgi:hypothetical protein